MWADSAGVAPNPGRELPTLGMSPDPGSEAPRISRYPWVPGEPKSTRCKNRAWLPPRDRPARPARLGAQQTTDSNPSRGAGGDGELRGREVGGRGGRHEPHRQPRDDLLRGAGAVLVAHAK